MNTTTKRFGRKDAAGTPAVPKIDNDETKDAFLARCKALGCKAEDAESRWNYEHKGAGNQDNDVTIAQLTTLIADAVKAAFKTEGYEKIDDKLLAKSIADELAKANVDSKSITADQIKAVAEAAGKAQADTLRQDAKNVRTGSDAGSNGAGSQVEIPYALCKGNLPLHMKQLSNVLCGKRQDEGIDAEDLANGKKHEDAFWGQLQLQGTKALTTSGDGTGADWVPRSLSSELYRRMYLESQIAQAFLAGEVQMPTNPYDYPLLTTDPTFYLNNVENTDPDASDLGSGGFTLTAQRLMALCQFSYEANEDAILPLLPTIQQTLGRAGSRALENALINGDTTATHFDTGYTVSTKDVRRAWKGLRKLATAASLTVDMATGGIDRSNLLAIIKLMGKYGVSTKDLLWIVGYKGWTSLLDLDEVATAYARGQQGTYLTGGPTPAPWGGMIAVSEQVGENLTANAIYDGVTTTKGQIICLNKSGFVMGSRREFTVEVQRNIKSQTWEVVASFRKAFQPVEAPSSTITTVAIGRNYAA